MSNLKQYFGNASQERDGHPLIRLLESRQAKQEFGSAEVEIIRPRAVLGFAPAQLSLHFFDTRHETVDYKIEPWDAPLNQALVNRSVRAIDRPNEIQRYGLALAAALQPAESRYGDGFFSAVLMLVVDGSPFANMTPIQEMRPHIFTNRPYEAGHGSEDCSTMIRAALQDLWQELREKLGYSEADAEQILAGALAYYLDERFSISDGRKLGWLKAH